MVSKASTEDTKYLENTLDKGFETFHLHDIAFTLPGPSSHEGEQFGGAPSPPEGYRLYKSRFSGLVALVIIFFSSCSVSDSEPSVIPGNSWNCRWHVRSMVRSYSL